MQNYNYHNPGKKVRKPRRKAIDFNWNEMDKT